MNEHFENWNTRSRENVNENENCNYILGTYLQLMKYALENV